ncbi:MAG: TSUP family transporter [Parvibaculum sp.]|nr:TSUP family transporter [Parvibaculum sp.]
MSFLLGASIAFVAFVTSAISGVFGMSGGMILMGYLAFVLPVSAAMIMHGATQAVANGYRAYLNGADIEWKIFGRYLIGSMIALAILSAIAFVPSKVMMYLLLGIVPFIAAAVPQKWALDVTKTGAAEICGLAVTLLNLTAGVAGALLDVFFVRTTLTRHQVVATKAVTQTLSHILKLVYFGVIVGAVTGDTSAHYDPEVLPWWIFAVVIPLSMLGTTVGKKVLDRMTDTNFRLWSQRLTLAIGTVLLLQGLALLLD